MAELTCEEFADLGAELALGLADAHQRTAALAHLDHCSSCRAGIRQLSDVADALVAMAPPAEPPAGFESRLLEHLAELKRPPSRWHLPLRRVLQVAAGLAVAGLIGAGGWLIGDAGRPAPTVDAGHLATAKLLAAGHQVGDVVIDTDGTPWMSMDVQMGAADYSQLHCQVITAAGRTIAVGSFTLSDGSGMWSVPLPPGTGRLRAAQLVDGAGRVMASASLPGG